ncbi:unnamed protein product [Ectocarpus sp. 6 AP-2014]
MFVPAVEKGRALWFSKDCVWVWADEGYGLVGLFVGLAVYSGVILDVPLPLVVFKQILGEQLSLEGCAVRRRLFFSSSRVQSTRSSFQSWVMSPG